MRRGAAGRNPPAVYERATRTVICLTCSAGAAEPATGAAPTPAAQPVMAATQPPTVPASTRPETRAEAVPRTEPDLLDYAVGAAGASARAEYVRRHERRETRVRAAHPHLGGVILALSSDPQSTDAWAVGAVGEEKLGAGLSRRAGPLLRVLHDCRIPGSRANIDHIAVTPSGIYVIDAKRYRGRPDVRFSKPFGLGEKQLWVGGRNCTRLVDGVAGQVERVRDVVGPDVPIHGVLCFIEADWGLLDPPLTFGAIRAVWPRRLYAWLEQAGEADAGQIAEQQRLLAEVFLPRR